MNNYIIVNRDSLEERMIELKKLEEELLQVDRSKRNKDWDEALQSFRDEQFILGQIIAKSLPLIPEIKKAFSIGHNKGAFHIKRQFRTGELTFANSDDYILNLKLDL